jgi:hypothetical protein
MTPVIRFEEGSLASRPAYDPRSPKIEPKETQSKCLQRSWVVFRVWESHSNRIDSDSLARYHKFFDLVISASLTLRSLSRLVR